MLWQQSYQICQKLPTRFETRVCYYQDMLFCFALLVAHTLSDNFKHIMDPTKPILDLYGDINYDQTQRSHRPRPQQQQYPQHSHSHSRHNRGPPAQKQISYAELKEKYQQLYQAYTEKVEQTSTSQDQLEQYRNENDRLREQLRRLQDKNQQLNATVLNKNVQLEEAYRQLQEDIRRGQKSRKNDEALDRLEEGLREAIVSNFNLLKEAALSQLKQY